MTLQAIVAVEAEQPDNPRALSAEKKRAPWESDPYGLVSLLDMLRYAADEFYKISQDLTAFGTATDQLLQLDRGREKLQELVESLHGQATKLGLTLTLNQLEVVVNAANAVRRGGSTSVFSSAVLELNKRVREELAARKFCYIPQDKAGYFYSFDWLLDSPIYNHKDLYDEFEAAGRCYALDENTACVFHLMRCVDWGLRRVAASLDIAYDARNWNGIGQAIEKKMQQKYELKTDGWKKTEPEYAEILTDIQAIGRGHRNPVLHEIEKKYTPREAHHLIEIVEGFCRHVATRWPNAGGDEA